MNRRDIVIGAVVLAVVAGVIYFVRRPTPTLEIPEPSVEDRMEEDFNYTFPEDADRAELTDVAGGTASGIASRKYEDGRFEHAVLADLPDPAPGEFYEGWLVMGDKFFSTGKMKLAKGGYLLEFSSGTDYSEYDEVVITRETIFDAAPETHVLEGSF